MVMIHRSVMYELQKLDVDHVFDHAFVWQSATPLTPGRVDISGHAPVNTLSFVSFMASSDVDRVFTVTNNDFA